MSDLDTTMRAIQARDPDGGSVQPTERDYVRFRAWVIDAFGPESLVRYMANDWGPVSDV